MKTLAVLEIEVDENGTITSQGTPQPLNKILPSCGGPALVLLHPDGTVKMTPVSDIWEYRPVENGGNGLADESKDYVLRALIKILCGIPSSETNPNS